MSYTQPIQSPGVSSQANLAALAKAHASKVENPKRSDSAAANPAVLSAQDAQLVSRQVLTDAQPPIADLGQAAAATQQASLLFRAHPQVALAAQANASSQSVQRLLQ